MLSVGSINIDSGEDKEKKLSYKIYDNINEKVSSCEQIESNTLSPTSDNTGREGFKTTEVSFLGKYERHLWFTISKGV